MKDIIDRACDVECVTESDAKAVAALADLAVQLQARLESLEKDAIRYRWLRDGNAYEPEEAGVIGGIELDDLIDTAMQSAQERSE